MAQKANKENDNVGKVKLTHVRSGKVFFKTPEEAERIMSHPQFKNGYKVEQLAETPKEIAEVKTEAKTEPGAAADQQADETK